MKGPSSGVDNRDFQILHTVATFERDYVSSWDVCQRLFPNEDVKIAQNHLCSVIWRLNKLARLKFLKKHPHPTRKGKRVYSLPGVVISVDGIVFIPSPVGGIILNCTYIVGCKKCCFGSKHCKLASVIKSEGLELVLKIAKTLLKMDGTRIEL